MTALDARLIGRQAKADDAAMRYWYRLAHDSGWWIGYRFAYHEIGELDRRRMARLHGIATTPAYADLERKRWDGKREDFGKPRPGDFTGFGAEYEPATYYVPQLPGGASRHRAEGAT